MASYAADIRIGVTGKAQLNQLEAQLKRAQTAINKLNKSLKIRARVQRVRLDTRQANTALKQVEDRINRLGRTITVRVRSIEDRQKARQSEGGGGTIINTGRSVQAAALVGLRQREAVQQRITAAVKDQSSSLRTVAKINDEVAKIDAKRLDAQQEIDRLNKKLPEQGGRQNFQDLVERGVLSKTKQAQAQKLLQRVKDEGLGPGDAGKEFKRFYDNLPKSAKRAIGLVDNEFREQVQRRKNELAQLNQRREQLVGRAVAAEKAGENRITQNLEREVSERDQALIDYEKRRQRQIARIQKRDALRRKKAQAQGLKRAAGAGAAAGLIQGPLGSIAGAGAAGYAVGKKRGAAIAAGIAGLVELSAVALRFANDAAKTSAEVEKLRVALKNISGEEYARNLGVIRNVVDDFNVPLKEATEQFTRLAAATDASGLTGKQTETIFRGLAAANKALGGDSERLQGILLATTQVISKGKVQAEELRGQIGERLPGAFALFAKATGMSTEELDKALRDGKVTLEDFVKFAETLLDKYEEDARKIADGPAEAGARLEKELVDLKVAIGPLLASIGAEFQNFASDVLRDLQPLIQELNKFLRLDRKGKNDRLYELTGGGTPGKGRIEKLRAQLRDLAGRKNDGQFFVDRQGLGMGPAGYWTTVGNAFKVISRELVRAEGSAAQLAADLYPKGRTPETPLTGNGSGTGGGGGKTKTKKGPTDRTPQLRAELALEQELLEITKKKDSLSTFAAQELEREARLKRELVDISNQNITEDSKRLATQLALTKFQREGLEIARQRKQALKERVTEIQNQIALAGVATERDRVRLEFEQQIAAVMADQNMKLEHRETLVRNLRELQSIRVAQADPFNQWIKQTQTNLEDTRQITADLAESLTGELANGISSVFSAFFDETKSAQEAFADMMKGFARILIQQGAVMIAQYIAIGIARQFAGISSGGSSGGPNVAEITKYSGIGANTRIDGLAKGGPAIGGTPYIVGEKGPELFVPGQSGRVIPNGSFGETSVSIVINENGSAKAETRGQNAEDAARLARMIEASTVSIINREKRPGGILSR